MSEDSKIPTSPVTASFDVPASVSNSVEDVRIGSLGTKRTYEAVKETEDEDMEELSSPGVERERSERGLSDSFVDVDAGGPSAVDSDNSYEYIKTPPKSERALDRYKEIQRRIKDYPLKQGDECYVCSVEWLKDLGRGNEVEWDSSLVQTPLALPKAAGELLEYYYENKSGPVYKRVIEVDGDVDVEPYRPVIYLRLFNQVTSTAENLLKKRILKPYMSEKIESLMEPSLIDTSLPFELKLWRVSDEEDFGSGTIDEDDFARIGKTELENYDKSLLELQFRPKECVIVQLVPSTKPPQLPPRAATLNKGKVGLSNLGNTCYMNSALQCLAHVEELVCYFLSNEYEKDLNTDNPIGYGGNVAKSYAKLQNHLYGTADKSYSPSEFKMTVGRYNQTFSGYGQQDTQEFLQTFLLDGLHEDLNRIKKKPATEKPELPDDKVNDKEAVAQLAKECWEMHKKRNDSVILELFAGLYRSILVCPECEKVSITFDPYMDLTLPLPVDTHWMHDIIVLPLNGSPGVVKVVMNKHDTISDLKRYLGEKAGVNANCLHITDVFHSRHFAHLDDKNILSVKIGQNDVIVACEYDRPTSNDVFLVPVLQNKQGTAFGYPFVITLTDEEACNRELVEKKLIDRARHALGVEEVDPQSVGYFKSYSSANARVSRSPLYLSHRNEAPESFDRRQPIFPPTPDDDVDMHDTVRAAEGHVDDDDDATMKESVSVVDDADRETQEPEESTIPASQDPFVDGDDLDDLASVSENGQNIRPPENVSDQNEDEDEDDQYGNLISLVRTPGSSRPVSLSPPSDEATENGQLVFRHEGLGVTWGQDADSSVTSAIANAEAEEILDKMDHERSKGLELDDCLDLFSKTEVLGENDLWYCSRCQEMRQATKTIELWSVPDIFTIHLKRFSSFRTFSDKITNRVTFPIEGLDMTKRVLGTKEGEELIYDLFAVDNHFGGLGGGHYTAYGKNFIDNEWYCFDDSSVRKIDPEEAVTPAAYLLFYRRRTSDNAPLGTDRIGQVVKQMREQNYPAHIPQNEPRNAFRGPGRILGSSSSSIFGSDSRGSGGRYWGAPTATLNLRPKNEFDSSSSDEEIVREANAAAAEDDNQSDMDVQVSDDDDDGDTEFIAGRDDDDSSAELGDDGGLN